MPQNARAVPLNPQHINVPKGANALDSKTITNGNTIVTIHSTLVNKTPEQIQEWFDQAIKRGDPVALSLVTAVSNIVHAKDQT
ncbi:hypothetical protein [Halalkalibacter sp. APA_J-10(15)]|uniref:hypothetical protein n=1 Tax=Halalkalibacter sp. APA_J-10(15) TaxID=2933805 RepID=UPI001FF1A352|nr:hypothetical protein [Halalkalibacter sp. APA_J-10(15)]